MWTFCQYMRKMLAIYAGNLAIYAGNMRKYAIYAGNIYAEIGGKISKYTRKVYFIRFNLDTKTNLHFEAR